ncbi:HypC/HybG/HupF family hydrogenase formation chaperone [Schlesneria paludicola]|uniref:HypC/HybG/HupF family hydrogenase formation chaperone n=1 Tax=Schlesneria paludicola TaxID=360056 RepID=UPI00029A62D2|nr:HypC/HybG/HupF family hydrogenase formation chaperone [Schlesneria paludicola]
MCLGIPGEVIETYSEHDMLMAKVDFGGVFKRVCLQHTPEAQIGDFVIVHVGFSLQVIDADEAQRVFQFLKEMDDLQELSHGETFVADDRDSFRARIS